MSDYSRIAKVIAYLNDHYKEQPDLEELAGLVGLSTFHFHRLFRRWAGTTPKAFLQCLVAGEAKGLLSNGRSVLDTTLDVGLSGPSRLHDLFVSLETASPGEIKSGGEGWIINAGFAATPFGRTLLAEGPRGICWLSFVMDGSSKATEWTKLRASWPQATLLRDDESATSLVERIFAPQGKVSAREPFKALVNGTAFQVKVWRALLDVPFGGLCSYGDVANELEMPGSARAVGNAVSNNSLAFLVPCHRVIASTGMTGNYRWGQTRKQAMIGWEQSLCRT